MPVVERVLVLARKIMRQSRHKAEPWEEFCLSHHLMLSCMYVDRRLSELLTSDTILANLLEVSYLHWSGPHECDKIAPKNVLKFMI